MSASRNRKLRRLPRRAFSKGERGQSIVLLAVTSLILAATLLTTFSIGKAIHERIAVQQASDAAAYSLAVEEARAFNYYAYANRASVSHYLAIMAIYGHMSYLLGWEAYLNASLNAWCNDFLSVKNQILLTQVDCWAADFNCPFGSYCLSITSECECVDSEHDAVGNICQNAQNTLQNLQNSMSGDINTLHAQAQSELGIITGTITPGERKVDTAVFNALTKNTFTDAIAKQFNPQFGSVMTTALGTIAKNGVSASGIKTAAGYCDATAGFACTPQAANVFRTQFTDANASRYQPPTGPLAGDFTRDRKVDTIGAPAGSTIAANLLQIFASGAPTYHIETASGNGMSRLASQNGATGDPSADLHVSGETNSSGYRVAAHDHGSVNAADILMLATPGGGAACGSQGDYPLPPAAWSGGSFQAYAYSTPTGNPSGTHSAWSDSQNETDDLTDLGGCSDPTNPADCGILEPQINFRIATTNQSQVLFNQPRTFAVISETFDKTTWGPFGIKLDSAITMFDGSSNKSSYDNIVNNSAIQGRESILGVSSGLAYYHRPGMWREPPNFYNPYWRAKLQSFNATTDELSEVVKAAGYTGVNSGTNFLTSLPATQ